MVVTVVVVVVVEVLVDVVVDVEVVTGRVVVVVDVEVVGTDEVLDTWSGTSSGSGSTGATSTPPLLHDHRRSAALTISTRRTWST